MIEGKKYGAILTDPPWDFRTWSQKGKGRSPYYLTMNFDELAELPVMESAAKDCALFMWVVDSHLQTAINLIKAWGFIYKTIGFIWVKPSIGMGYWTRKQAEICLIATHGKPKRVNAGISQVITAPRREHSRKPDETYSCIEKLVAGPYLEMFARQHRDGWDSWGNETGKYK
tara:strand:- start:527 stop:1042 length:516 start_codon:yes stop_codon:yes gene_type:complete